MSREAHVRFWESAAVKLPRAARQSRFTRKYGLQSAEEIANFFDADCRWSWMKYVGPPDTMWADYCSHEANLTYSDALFQRPLAEASTVADVEAHDWPDPAWWQPDDYRAMRQRYPDHALVAGPPWMPLFCYGCIAFGMEGIMLKMLIAPSLSRRSWHAWPISISICSSVTWMPPREWWTSSIWPMIGPATTA